MEKQPYIIKSYSTPARKSVSINTLADIRDVEIDPALPREEREKSYLRQIKNPQIYRCDDMIVRISFTRTNITFKDRLKQYLLSGQGFSLKQE